MGAINETKKIMPAHEIIKVFDSLEIFQCIQHVFVRSMSPDI